MATENAAATPRNPWATSDSLPDDFTATITEAQFAYRSDYRDGEVPLLVIKLYPDNDQSAQEQEIRLGVGDGWTIDDTAGLTISHDFRDLVHRRTAYGAMIERVRTMPGIPTDGDGNPVLHADPAKNTPLCSEVWVGKTFHWKREEETYKGLKDEKTGEDVKTSRLLPQAFIPADQVAAVTGAPAPTAATASPASSPAATAAAPAADSAQLEAVLAAFVAQNADATTFMVAALGAVGPQLKAFPDLEKAVLDASPTGYFATHKA